MNAEGRHDGRREEIYEIAGQARGVKNRGMGTNKSQIRFRCGYQRRHGHDRHQGQAASHAEHDQVDPTGNPVGSQADQSLTISDQPAEDRDNGAVEPRSGLPYHEGEIHRADTATTVSK